MAATFYAIDPYLPGQVTVAVPEIRENFNSETVGRSFSSIADARSFIESKGYNWDFESTWIVKSATVKQAMLDLGFPRVLSADEISIGDYEFNNGSKIRVNGYNQYGLRVDYFFPDGTQAANDVIPGENNVAQTLMVSNVQGPSVAGGPALYWCYYIETISSTRISNIRCGNKYAVSQFSPFWEGMAPVGEEDPYDPGGVSGPGGGTGTFDGTGDLIPIPPLPTLSAVGTGFVTLYVPTTQQLKDLSDYMWNANVTTLDFWKKLVADPIDLILGLNIVPVAANLAGSKSVVVGFIDTGVSMYYTNTQYVEVDCGTLNIQEYWGAYLDYSPYTKAEIYLPYCGYHPIDIDDIMGKSVRVVYHVDILSGSVCAFVQCGGSVLYQFNGNCASEIPVTSSQYGDMVMSAISVATTMAGLPAASSDLAAAGTAHESGKWGGASTKEMGIAESANTLASIAGNVMKSKPYIARSGSIGSMGGQLAVQTPYLVITRPSQSIPANQNHFKGYPSNITAKLGTLKGYTVIDSVHLENIPCTLDEQREIDNILKTGVIF